MSLGSSGAAAAVAVLCNYSAAVLGTARNSSHHPSASAHQEQPKTEDTGFLVSQVSHPYNTAHT